MTTTPRSCRVIAVVASLAALSATACSGDPEPSGSAPPSSEAPSLAEPSDAPTLQVEPVVASGSITGRLPRRDRARVEKAVADRAVRFLTAAYLGGDYPRGDFRDAYPGFTGGAAAVARGDRTLLTNQAIGKRVDEVTATGLRVEVDLLANDQHAVAATTRVQLSFRTTGKVEKRYRVQGRLLMTKKDGRWKIFGYDLSKGAR
jgi:hypothetical protein